MAKLILSLNGAVQREYTLDDKWTKDQKMDLMQQILTAKVEQVEEFRSALVESGKQPIIYANKFEYDWASIWIDGRGNTTHEKRRMAGTKPPGNCP